MFKVNLSSAALGTTLGWTAPVFPKLENINDDNPLGRIPTPDEKSWIGAIIAIGALVGKFLLSLCIYNLLLCGLSNKRRIL